MDEPSGDLGTAVYLLEERLLSGPLDLELCDRLAWEYGRLGRRNLALEIRACLRSDHHPRLTDLIRQAHAERETEGAIQAEVSSERVVLATEPSATGENSTDSWQEP